MGPGMRRVRALGLALWNGVLGIAWAAAYVDHSDLMLPLGPAEILTMAVGSFLTLKGKGRLLGPLLLLGGSAGLVYDLGTVCGAVASDGRLAHIAAWLGVWTGPLAFVSVPMLLVLFPDGSFSGGRRWWLPIFTVLIGATLAGAFLMWAVPAADLVRLSTSDEIAAAYPAYGLVDVGFMSWVLIFPAGLTLAYRYWHSSSGQRQQIKWLLAGVLIVTPLAFLAGQLGVDDLLILGLAPCAAPIAIAIAVLRYRLYDLDRVVSRTVAYAVVVGLLGIVFAAGVVWLPNTLSGLEDSPVLVAVSTLAVAALFNPLRKRVQVWVDRRFNRSRYDIESVIQGFSASLHDRVDPQGLMDGWVGVVSETMQPEAVSVWVRP